VYRDRDYLYWNIPTYLKGGEDLYGWMKIKSKKYGEETIFNQNFRDNVEGGTMPIVLKDQKVYYFKYSEKEINNPDNNIELIAQLNERDDGSADDDFGHYDKRIPLNEIFSGAIIDNYLEDKSLEHWGTKPTNFPCNDCLVIPFEQDGSKVLIRYTIDLLDSIPPGGKEGF